MLRVLILGIVICALAGCAPLSQSNPPAAATASPARPAATLAPSASPPAGSAALARTSEPAASPTLAATAGAAAPAAVTPVATMAEATAGSGTAVATTPASTAAASTPAVAGTPAASEPAIVLVRSGGFAGRTETWTVYADGRVVSGQGERHVARELVSQSVAGLAAMGFFNLQDAYGQNTQCRDCYNYRLTVNSGGQSKTVSFVDNPADMPPGLGEAIAQLNSLLASAK